MSISDRRFNDNEIIMIRSKFRPVTYVGKLVQENKVSLVLTEVMELTPQFMGNQIVESEYVNLFFFFEETPFSYDDTLGECALNPTKSKFYSSLYERYQKRIQQTKAMISGITLV